LEDIAERFSRHFQVRPQKEIVSICILGCIKSPDMPMADTKSPRGRNASRALLDASAPFFEFSFAALADRQIRFRCEFPLLPNLINGLPV
jgi:hypothetical protein